MSDDTAKLLTRLATMEAELASLRNRKPEASAPAFDPAAFRAAFVADPVGTMTRMGAPVDHVTRVLVAHAMGDTAPPELKVLAAMGPQVNAAQALDAKVEALSRQLSDLNASSSKSGVRESFKAITADKTKYPHLAKALTADPGFFDEDLGTHGGSAEDFASKMEARLSKVGTVFGVTIAPPAASSEHADPNVQSQKDKPAALEGALNGSPPPLPEPKAGVFTAEDHAKLRDETVRKYA